MRPLIFCLLSWALGCGGAAQAPRPEAPSTFEGAPESPGIAPPARWWAAFQDPALDALIDRALSESLDLEQARARLEQAQAQARAAGADGALKLNANASAGRAWASNPMQEGDSFSLGLQASYEIDFWGRVRATRRAAAADLAASREALAISGLSLTAQIAVTWMTLRDEAAQRALLEAQAETNRRLLEVVEARFRAGRGAVQDVLRQRQQVESTASEVARLEADMRVQRHALTALLGGARDLPEAPDDAPALPARPPAAGVPLALLDRRPDVRQAAARLRAADERAAAAVASRYPTISLQASASTSAPKASDLFDDWLANLAGNLLQPILDGGRLEAEAERAAAAAREALAAYRQAVLGAIVEVEDALAREEGQRRVVESLNRQVELSAQALGHSRVSYANGATTYTALLDATRAHQGLERSLQSARALQIQYRVALCRALAGPVPMESK